MKVFSLIPLLNEKGYSLSQKGVYIFKVDLNQNIHQIKDEIESRFKVKIIKINSLRIKGKKVRTISINGKHQSNRPGRKSDFKKVYITLDKKDKLPFYESIEKEEKKQENTQKQLEKAINKNLAKEDKKLHKSETVKRRFSLRKQPESK